MGYPSSIYIANATSKNIGDNNIRISIAISLFNDTI
jgi:hypothetical protein